MRHDWVAFRLLAGKHGNGLAKLVLSDLQSFSNRAAWVGGAGHVGSRPLFDRADLGVYYCLWKAGLGLEHSELGE